MKKSKKFTILSLAVIGVLYGAATASASPFLSMIHDLVAFVTSPETKTNSATRNRDLDLHAGVSSTVGPTFFPFTEISDPTEALAQQAHRDIHSMRIGQQDAGGLTGSDQGAFTFKSGAQFSTSSAKLTGALALNDPYVKYLLAHESVFPNAGKPAKKVIQSEDKIAKADKSGNEDKIAEADKSGKEDKIVKENKIVKADKSGNEDKIVKEDKTKDVLSEAVIPVTLDTSTPYEGDRLAAPTFPLGPSENFLCESAYGLNPRVTGDSPRSDCSASNSGAGNPIARVSAIQAVPEPATLALLGLGLAGLGFMRRRRE